MQIFTEDDPYLPASINNEINIITSKILLNTAKLVNEFCHSNKGWSIRLSVQEPLPNTLTLKQIHGETIFSIDDIQTNHKLRSHDFMGDGIYYWQQKVFSSPIAVATADCLPIVLTAQVDGLYFGCVVHAGWRGFTQGIHQKAIKILLQLGKMAHISEKQCRQACQIFIGPAIWGLNYPCGSDVKAAFEQHISNFQITPSKAYLEALHSTSFQDISPDLQILAALEFCQTGIPHENVSILRINTYSSPVLPSYRRRKQMDAHSESHKTRFYTHLLAQTEDA